MGPAPASKSAIPVFLFLCLVLLFLPIMALTCVCIQRRRQRLRSEQATAETAERVAENLYRWSKPIELEALPPPPPIAIKSIRGMSSDKRFRQYTSSVLGQQDQSFHRHCLTTDLAPQVPARTVQVEKDLPELPAPPRSPRCDLQTALEIEGSSAGFRTGNEKKAYVTDAPRVKSLKVHPEQAAEAFHSAERPPVPEFQDRYFTLEQQQYPARWA